MKGWLRAVAATAVACASSAVFAFDYFQPLPKEVPVPASNPLTEQKAELGKQLFFDTRLSVNGSISCNSCHDVVNGGADARPLSPGATGKLGRRNAPTVWNVGFQTVLFWDGRARSLEEQLGAHLLDETTMALPNARAVAERLAAIPGYRDQFARAFGEPASVDTVANALASYIRTLRTPDSAFDRYIRGDQQALSPEARHGMERFRDVGCLSCHFGVNFAGPAPGPALKMGDGFYELFPNYVGSHYDAAYELDKDLGRYHYSGDAGEKRMWRVPALRNIARTAPYFHNGSVSTLSEAVRVMARVELNTTLDNADVADIVAFLESLTGRFPLQTLPQLPPTPPDVVWPWQNPLAAAPSPAGKGEP